MSEIVSKIIESTSKKNRKKKRNILYVMCNEYTYNRIDNLTGSQEGPLCWEKAGLRGRGDGKRDESKNIPV